MRLKRDNSGAEQGTIVDVLDTSGQVIDTSEPQLLTAGTGRIIGALLALGSGPMP